MITKNHRTALVVYATADDPAYQERAVRLLSSVNNSGIKCDIYTVLRTAEGSLEVHRAYPNECSSETLVCSHAEMGSEFEGAGYDQIIHSHSRLVDLDVANPEVLTETFSNLSDYAQAEMLQKLSATYMSHVKSAMKEAGVTDEAIAEFFGETPEEEE